MAVARPLHPSPSVTFPPQPEGPHSVQSLCRYVCGVGVAGGFPQGLSQRGPIALVCGVVWCVYAYMCAYIAHSCVVGGHKVCVGWVYMHVSAYVCTCMCEGKGVGVGVHTCLYACMCTRV